MKKIWNIKIRPFIKKEFPKDSMMQELHEIRARLAKKYKPLKMKLLFRIGPVPLEKAKAK